MRQPPSSRAGAVGLALVLLLLVSSAEVTARAEDVPAQARAAYQAVVAGDVPRAMAESEAAITQAPTAPSVWKVRGYVLNRASYPHLALEAYREAVRLDDRDPVTHNNIGATFLKLNLPKEALTAFEAALSLDRTYADARNNRGVALEKLGRRREAEAAYREATRLNPQHAQAYNNLGAVQLDRGDVRSASLSFSRALELDPSFAAPSLNLALITEHGRVTEESVKKLEELAAQPGASTVVRARALAARAALHTEQKNYKEARALYLQAIELSPRSAPLLNNVAVVEDQLGMDREAILHLTDALEIDPKLYVAQNNVGIVHVHRNDVELAESAFKALLREAPGFHRAHYNLGVLQAAQGRVREARRSFRRAARLAPRDADTQYNLALLARRAGGDIMAERRGYERALRLDDNLTEAHLSLGTLLADPETPPRMRDLPRARRHLKRFLELAKLSDEEGRRQAEAWLEWLELETGGP